MLQAVTAPRVRDYIEDPWEMMVYRELRRAALAGEPCPTCDALVDLIGANAVATTVNIIRRLETRGLIKVKRYQRTRQVWVAEVDASTAEPSSDAQHWREGAVTIGDLRKVDVDLALNVSASVRAGVTLKDALMALVLDGAVARGLIQAERAQG